jgi:hypothetical protein
MSFVVTLAQRGELMHKKIIMLFSITTLLFGCGSAFNVLIRDDPFKKSTMVKVEMWHNVVEGYLDNYSMIYEREIKDGKKSPVIVSFKFFASHYFNGKDLEDKIYLLIDDRSFSFSNVRLGTCI